MELLRKVSKKHYFKRTIVYLLTCCMLLSTSLSVARAGPEGAKVVNGKVSFQQSGYNTVVTASDKSIINYSRFDIARPEIVEFVQPGRSASVLNRILSTNPTNINGTLLANGRVFFVNPAGVYIGAGARINVNQLVASGLNITNADFINGQYNFVGGNGSVINSGDISAESVYLIGKQVANSGSISCPAGYVVMAAGDRVFLGEPGSDIVLEVDVPSLSDPVDSGPAVLNEGTVNAAGGKIVLAAAGDIYSQAISNVGSLSVSAETSNGGQIKLVAADGTITNTGTIEASGSKGGQVTMEGARVGQFGTVHADGTQGDGGNVDLLASDVVALSSDSLTTANAGSNGDGGDVIVFSADTALFWPDAKIQAKGGSESGNGGFVEVSGKENLLFNGLIDTSAALGETGTLLIDPPSLTIAAGPFPGVWVPYLPDPPFFYDFADSPVLDPGDIAIQLSSTNVLLLADMFIDVLDPIFYASANELKLRTIFPGSFINIFAPIDNSGPGNVTVNVGTGGWINLYADINLNGGTLSGNAPYVNVLGNPAEIQDAIDIASPYATVNVSAGTYTEDLTITKNGLNLAGASKLTTTIKGQAVEPWTSWPLAVPNIDILADDIWIHGFTIESPDVPNNNYSSGLVLTGQNIQIYDNIFRSVSKPGGDGGCVVIQTYDQSSIPSSDISGLQIKNNTFSGTPSGGYVGVFINRDNDVAPTGTVTIGGALIGDKNTFQGNVAQGVVTERSNTIIQNNDISTALSSDSRGVIVMDWDQLAQDSVIVQDNTITGFEYGIRIGHGAGTQVLTNITVENNAIQNNTTGVQVRSSADGVSVNYNKITGNTTGVDNTHAATLDATYNWWGDATGPDDDADLNPHASPLGDQVTGNVNFMPWYATDTTTSSTENVTVDHPTSSIIAVSDSIQGGIDAAVDGGTDTVQIAAGTYSEDVTVDKSLTLSVPTGTATMTSLTSDASKTTGLLGNFTVNGIIDPVFWFKGAVTLIGNVILTSSNNKAITFDSTVDGGFALAVNTTGATTFGDNVGTGVDLASLTTNTGGTTTISGDVTTTSGITFGDSVTADGTGLQTLDAGAGILDVDDNIDKTTTGGLTLAGDAGIKLAKDVKATGSGATDVLKFENAVDADVAGLQTLDAGAGILDVDDNIDKTTTGGLTLAGDAGIKLAKDVKATGSGAIDILKFENAVDADVAGLQTLDAGAGILDVDDNIDKTTTGGLTLAGDAGIKLAKDVKATGSGAIDILKFENAVDADVAGLQTLDAGAGILDVDDNINKTTTGGLTLAGDAGIKLAKDVKATGSGAIDILKFENAVDADGAGLQTLDAGAGILDVDDNINKTTTGGLTLAGDAGIKLAKDVKATGSGATDVLKFENAVDADVAGLQTLDAGAGILDVDDNIDKTTTGGLTLAGDAGIKLAKDVKATGSGATDVLKFENAVDADGGAAQTIDAGGGTLHAWNTITKTGTGGLNLTGNTLVDLDNTVDVQSAASNLVVTGTVDADALLKATGNIDLKNAATLGGNVTAVSGDIDFRGTVAADGGATQTFNAGGGTLHAWNTITKTGTGGLNLTGNTSVDLDNTVDVQSAASNLVVIGTVDADALLKATGNIDLKNAATLGGNVTAVSGDIDFRGTVAADGGATQTFNAGDGTLHAWNTITKTAGTDLTLQGTLIDLDGMVDVQGGSLILDDSTIVAAGETLKARDNILVTVGTTLTGEGNLTLEATNGGTKHSSIGGKVPIKMAFDDNTLTLNQKDTINMANFTVKNSEDTDLVANSTKGSVSAVAGDDNPADKWKSITATANSGITLQGTGNITTKTLTSTNGDIKIESKSAVVMNDDVTTSEGGGVTVTALSDITTQAITTEDQKVTTNSNIEIRSLSSDLSINDALTANGGSVSLIADNGSITTKNAIAETGISIEAESHVAVDSLNTNTGNISAHSETGNLNVNNSLTANGGGVSLIADNGKIYSSDDTLDVAISGYSDGTAGVPLPNGSGRAAIVIQSKEDLKLGSSAILTANGIYNPKTETNPGGVDEREDIGFAKEGDPFDIAIYLGSLGTQTDPGNIDLGSGTVSIDNTAGVGTLVVDAGDTVTFTTIFEDSLKLNGTSDVKRIEAASRISEDMTMARGLDRDPGGNDPRLPHADYPEDLADGQFILSEGVYVLRGTTDGLLLSLAHVLALTQPVPLALPLPLEPELRGEVEEPDIEALMRWLAEQGIGVQPYLAEAYQPSLNTDLELYKAALKLQNFAALLQDTDGTHIAALRRVVGEVVAVDTPPTEEQAAAIAQTFADHVGDSTYYALAGQWIDALTNHVGVLNSDIGWPVARSVGFVMKKYGTVLGDDIRTAMFVQMHLQRSFGG